VLAIQADMTVGEFTQFVTMMLMLLTPLKSLAEVNGPMQRGIAAAETVFSIIDAPVEHDPGTRTLERAQGHLRFEHVSFTYPGAGAPALSDITLDVQPGQTVALGWQDLELENLAGGVNISTWILIVHGWFYVVYLVSCFRVWTLMRWPFPQLVVMALGGVVPFLSFVVERKIHASTTAELRANPKAAKRY
jgi:integral membrane protein